MGRQGEPVGMLPWGVVLLLLSTALSWAAAAAASGEGEGELGSNRTAGGGDNLAKLGTIAFASVGRSHFGFDLFGVKLPDSWAGKTSSDVLSAAAAEGLDELRLTDGVSINYNGQLVEGEARAAVLEHLRSQGVNGKTTMTMMMW